MGAVHSDITGKKVFFLHPHSAIQTEILESIVASEYTAYLLNNSAKTRKLLAGFPDSILFINNDETTGDQTWERYMGSTGFATTVSVFSAIVDDLERLFDFAVVLAGFQLIL